MGMRRITSVWSSFGEAMAPRQKPMDLHKKYGLRRVINAYDKATSLGGSRVAPEIVEVVAAALPHNFELVGMQEAAGGAIAEATGADWGGVTACAAAAITLGVAASMTGADAAKVAQLPDTDGMADRVIIQKGHCISFGAPVTQMIRLAGATVVEVGQANGCSPWAVRHELERGNVAAVFAVESYHTAAYAGVLLPELAELAHEYGAPLIVDAATQELRIRDVLDTGADLVGCSAHKYFQSTTAGVMAGRRDLVEAALLQNQGIGRGMKPGKEAILGVVAAMELYSNTDLEQWASAERQKLEDIMAQLGDVPGLRLSLSPDPNGCPIDRIEAEIDTAATGLTSQAVHRALLEGDPVVYIRIHNRDPKRFVINATEMRREDVEVLCDRIRRVFGGS